MHIELIGCTSAGKSSLSQRVIQKYNQDEVQIITSYDFVLDWARFGWVKNHKARMAILNLAALFACLMTWRNNRSLFRLIAEIILRLPKRVGITEKLKIARIAARNIGIYEIVRRYCKPYQIVLADEGTLHIASYLFVHVAQAPDMSRLQAFLRLVSLPDAVVYLRQSKSVLVDRTLQRGHKRIPGGSPEFAGIFIQHNLSVLEALAADPKVTDRLLIHCNGDILPLAAEQHHNPRLAAIRKIFAASLL